MPNATTTNPRIRKRLPCEFSVSGTRHTGMVLNLSAGGLFVQTNASLRTGEWIEIELPLSANPQPLAMRAAVVWRKVVPRQLHGTTHSGVGVELLSVPRDYQAFVASMLPATASEASSAPIEATTQPAAEPAAPIWRVRIKLQESPRSKTLLVEASDETQAFAKALNRAGKGWTGLEAHCQSPGPEDAVAPAAATAGAAPND